MDNYYYIIAGLPDISPEWTPGERPLDDIRQEIRDNCSMKDNRLIDILERGFEEDGLNREFYAGAVSSKNRFIREYFTFDLHVRNSKVKYLNKALGRDLLKDVIVPEGMNSEPSEFEAAGRLDAILHGTDILERERALDALMWEKIDDITTFDYFDIEAVLGFLAKLKIVERWLKLDEKAGREMFRKLVDEVRGTFKGVKYAG